MKTVNFADRVQLLQLSIKPINQKVVVGKLRAIFYLSIYETLSAPDWNILDRNQKWHFSSGSLRLTLRTGIHACNQKALAWCQHIGDSISKGLSIRRKHQGVGSRLRFASESKRHLSYRVVPHWESEMERKLSVPGIGTEKFGTGNLRSWSRVKWSQYGNRTVYVICLISIQGQSM